MPDTRASSRRDRLDRAVPSFLPLAWVTMMASFLVPPPAVAQEGCASCHAALVKTTHVHAPTEDCSSCHESVATPHPQPGTKTFKLTQQVPGLCATCHEAFGKSVVHAPVKEGSCTTCHDPHGSEQAKLLTATPGELCSSCHAEVTEFKYPHGPVSAGDCLVCHDPHQSEIKALLARPGDALCAGCHLDAQAFSKAKVVHAALEAGCISCHRPHGAAQPKLLSESGSQVCSACHDEIAAKAAKASVPHAPVNAGKGCVSCHSAHASDNPKLLLKIESETCLGCHKAVLPKIATVRHGPIADGQCTPCHDPHGGSYAKLLVAEFPTPPYVPYTATQFPLCFGCHDRALVQDPETSVATGFRDGKKNLHYLHVNNEQKGRSCKLCHEVHGGPNPKLIASSVPFGRWSLPVGFVKTGSGGSCAPGCHRPYSYDRENPGRTLEVPGPVRKRN
jgi:predicted CXXCH cytochrome family protein